MRRPGGKSKAGSFKRGTRHFKWSIWFKAICLLFEAVSISRGKQEQCKADILPLDNTGNTQRKTLSRLYVMENKIFKQSDSFAN